MILGRRDFCFLFEAVFAAPRCIPGAKLSLGKIKLFQNPQYPRLGNGLRFSPADQRWWLVSISGLHGHCHSSSIAVSESLPSKLWTTTRMMRPQWQWEEAEAEGVEASPCCQQGCGTRSLVMERKPPNQLRLLQSRTQKRTQSRLCRRASAEEKTTARLGGEARAGGGWVEVEERAEGGWEEVEGARAEGVVWIGISGDRTGTVQRALTQTGPGVGPATSATLQSQHRLWYVLYAGYVYSAFCIS
jgi:hypothetical protein